MTIYTTPYTYHIGWTNQNKYYYGVKYANGCHPSTFWQDYHTSSKLVADMREEHGEPDLIDIRQTFANANDATAWEHKVINKLRLHLRDDYLNQACWPSVDNKGEKHYLYGKTHSEETISKMSEDRKGKPKSEEHKNKIAESMKGKPKSEEHKRNMSEKKKGIPQPKVTCPHCNLTGGRNIMTRWHFDNCKHKR